MKKPSVVVPVYNECALIEEILWRVQAVAMEKEIIVVDDASTDGIRQFLEKIIEAQRAVWCIFRYGWFIRQPAMIDARLAVDEPMEPGPVAPSVGHALR
jgi:cellulose synthase/poly-beta-1,6-N-acetylglucosamine synthase-like glycosyltransferase